MPLPRQASTLIELLIVVAIIAILAAIAVPNFLEAQTRSKVSRVKADQRALATALEAYYIDNNDYPPSANGPLGNGYGPNSSIVQYFVIPLSTPIAFMANAMLPDPFGNEEFAYNPEAGFRKEQRTMKLKVYAYKNCGTCRKAAKYLQGRGIDFEEIPIRERPPAKAEIKRMIKARDGELKPLFNTSGGDYREMKLKDKMPKMTESQAIDLLAGNGNLIKRPFVLGPGVALVGFKPDEWDKAIQ